MQSVDHASTLRQCSAGSDIRREVVTFEARRCGFSVKVDH